MPAKHAVERARDAHQTALRTLRRFAREDNRLLEQLRAASAAGDHERVVDFREALDRVPVQRWSAQLAERRALLALKEAELDAANQQRVILGPQRRRLEARIDKLQAALTRVRTEIGGVMGVQSDLRFWVASLRREIAELESSESAWGPVLRGRARTADSR